MKPFKEIDNLSMKYKKYISLIILNNSNYYLISGEDTEGNDRLLINDKNEILLSHDILKLANYSRYNKVFDNSNFKKWVNTILPLLKENKHYYYAEFDLDSIYKNYISSQRNILLNNSRANYNEYINFINLVHDYSLQANSDILIKLINNKYVNLFWEISYDKCLWKKNSSSDNEKGIFKSFDNNTFRVSIAKIYSIFISNIRFI